MNIIISGKQMDLTDGIKDAIGEKLGRLDFYLHPSTEVKVTVSAKKARQKVEVTIIPISGPIIRAEDSEESLYAAIDIVYDKLNKQLRKYKIDCSINFIEDMADSINEFLKSVIFKDLSQSMNCYDLLNYIYKHAAKEIQIPSHFTGEKPGNVLIPLFLQDEVEDIKLKYRN